MFFLPGGKILALLGMVAKSPVILLKRMIFKEKFVAKSKYPEHLNMKMTSRQKKLIKDIKYDLDEYSLSQADVARYIFDYLLDNQTYDKIKLAVEESYKKDI